jgi:sugar/nucleoside kinase (ribokinase family)
LTGPAGASPPAAGEAELLCIGNALVDIFARTEGTGTGVRHVGPEELAGTLARLSPADLLGTCAGGGAANVAKIAALLGVRTAFAGSVGSADGAADPYGRLFAGELSRAGVRLFLRRCRRLPTGALLTLTAPSGESRIIAAPAAALEFSPADIPEEALMAARAVVLDGYMLARDALVTRVLALAGRRGTAVALDVGSADLAAARAPEILRYCREYPLLLFMNEAEALAFYRALHGEGAGEQAGERRLDRNVRSFLKGLTQDGPFPVIAVKRGSRGAAVYARGERYPARSRVFIPGDSTGAGDAFCAGFLAGWLRDRPPEQCALLGNRTARKVLGTPGTTAAFQTIKALSP